MDKGYVIYLFGRSGSGKTTIADHLEEKIRGRVKGKVQVIDGDEIRAQFGNIFGYTFEERMKCNQAVRTVLHYLVRNDIHVILTQVGAYQQMRDNLRKQFDPRYIEIYIKCDIETCIQRDVKGYYARNEANINGLTDTFEEPVNSDMVINTDEITREEATDRILGFLLNEKYGL
jgi:adenylylsulfate kinase